MVDEWSKDKEEETNDLKNHLNTFTSDELKGLFEKQDSLGYCLAHYAATKKCRKLLEILKSFKAGEQCILHHIFFDKNYT